MQLRCRKWLFLNNNNPHFKWMFFQTGVWLTVQFRKLWIYCVLFKTHDPVLVQLRICTPVDIYVVDVKENFYFSVKVGGHNFDECVTLMINILIQLITHYTICYKYKLYTTILYSTTETQSTANGFLLCVPDLVIWVFSFSFLFALGPVWKSFSVWNSIKVEMREA